MSGSLFNDPRKNINNYIYSFNSQSADPSWAFLLTILADPLLQSKHAFVTEKNPFQSHKPYFD